MGITVIKRVNCKVSDQLIGLIIFCTTIDLSYNIILVLPRCFFFALVSEHTQ